jgi:hypothetical protein
MYPDIHEAKAMRIDRFTFGSIRIDDVIYEHDVVIARGRVRQEPRPAAGPVGGASSNSRSDPHAGEG